MWRTCRLLEETVEDFSVIEREQTAAVELLRNADLENKLSHKKMYLVCDLDETLVYTKRLPPGETALGHKILVRGEPYDMVLRPGLRQFLKVASQSFVVYLYTMGDEDYTQAALSIIDPGRTLFTGRPPHPASFLPPSCTFPQFFRPARPFPPSFTSLPPPRILWLHRLVSRPPRDGSGRATNPHAPQHGSCTRSSLLSCPPPPQSP